MWHCIGNHTVFCKVLIFVLVHDVLSQFLKWKLTFSEVGRTYTMIVDMPAKIKRFERFDSYVKWSLVLIFVSFHICEKIIYAGHKNTLASQQHFLGLQGTMLKC